MSPEALRAPPNQTKPQIWCSSDGKPRLFRWWPGWTTRSSWRSQAAKCEPGDLVDYRKEAHDDQQDRHATPRSLSFRRTPVRRSNMPDPIIRVVNVTRTYHVGDVDVHALRGVNLTVEPGEFIAIMGSSGSGKSTLMSLLGCLDRPSSGEYYLEGVNVAGLTEPELARIRSERLGFVFQSFNLLSRTSAIENLALPLFYASGRGFERYRARPTSQGIVETPRFGRPGGSRNTQRQCSGRADSSSASPSRAPRSTNPILLLADEPTGNLSNTKTSHEIMVTLQALRPQAGRARLLSGRMNRSCAASTGRVIATRDSEVISDERKQAVRPQPGAPSGALPAGSLSRPRPTGTAYGRGRHSAKCTLFALMIVAAAFQALARNKMRSALTMLGVFIGVAALIAMVAVGQGANDAVRKQIESLGTNLLVVVPGATTMGGMRSGQGSASTLTVIDAEALRREAPAVGSVSYLIRQSGQVQYANQNWSTSIQGISAHYSADHQLADRVVQGRGISQEDDNSPALVAVLGQTVSRQLFGVSENPIGCNNLGQERAVARDRHLRIQGTNLLRDRSGRSRHDPFHDRAAQGSWRGGAKPATGSAQLGLSLAAQSIQSSAATDGVCEPDLRPGK